jgi:DNA-binding response OmpR family regulator
MKKILIIEDEHVLNDMYALKFRKEGFDVTSSYDGLDGLTKISQQDPDLILLDIMMPSMNGFETLEAIRMQTSSNCKIVMFTNVVDQEKLNEALSMGADGYLIKSNTTPADAVKTVQEILGQPVNTDASFYVQP